MLRHKQANTVCESSQELSEFKENNKDVKGIGWSSVTFNS